MFNGTVDPGGMLAGPRVTVLIVVPFEETRSTDTYTPDTARKPWFVMVRLLGSDPWLVWGLEMLNPVATETIGRTRDRIAKSSMRIESTPKSRETLKPSFSRSGDSYTGLEAANGWGTQESIQQIVELPQRRWKPHR